MQICIVNLMHKDHPFIWEYNESLNQAECLFKLAGTNQSYEKSALLESLKKTPGIDITAEGEAIIHDAKTFFATNDWIPVYKMNSVSAKPSDKSRFFEGPSTSGIIGNPSESTSLSSEHTASTSKQTNNVQDGIWLDSLIPNSQSESSLWGATLCYEEYFMEKTKEDELARRTEFLKSVLTIKIEQQYQKNGHLYPVKQQQIKIIRHLFDEVLAPLYEKIKRDEITPPTLISYFQKIIEGAMLNKPFNSGPTEYEKMSHLELQEMFKGDIHKILFAIAEARKARARLMLRPLLFFISDEIKSQHLTQDSEVKEHLDLLKEEAKKKAGTITNDLLLLEESTAQSGQIEYKFSLQEESLNRHQKEKSERVGSGFSCYHLVFTLLRAQLSDKIKDSSIHTMTEDVIKAIMETINKTMKGNPYVPKIFDNDDDLYFCEKWMRQLEKQLTKLIESKCPSKKLDKHKHQEELVHAINDSVIEFINHELPKTMPSQTEEFADGEDISTLSFN